MKKIMTVFGIMILLVAAAPAAFAANWAATESLGGALVLHQNRGDPQGDTQYINAANRFDNTKHDAEFFRYIVRSSQTDRIDAHLTAKSESFYSSTDGAYSLYVVAK